MVLLLFLLDSVFLKTPTQRYTKEERKKNTVKAENYMSVFPVLNGTCNLPATDLQSHTCSSPCWQNQAQHVPLKKVAFICLGAHSLTVLENAQLWLSKPINC